MNYKLSSLVVVTTISALMISVVGCGGKEHDTHPVRGLVRFPDGKLLRNGSVEFEIARPDQPVTARGKIRPDGTFVLGTYTLDDGAYAGIHRAVVIAEQDIGNGPERPGVIQGSPIDKKYRDFRKSGLEFEVKPGNNDIMIEVEYPKSKQASEDEPNPKPTRSETG